ncbi:restriction endonuclease subunit M, partial [Streptomyces platensis subsp. clarensis]|nr:restriction endonuclease subunit M [Streptomyces platensis subsp. clarensis]
GGPAELARVRDRLTATLARTTELTPRPAAGDTVPEPATARWPLTTVGELARSGALVLRAGGAGTASSELGDVPAVLTDHDVIGGGAPSGALPEAPASGPAEEPVLVHEGDVVVPVLGGGAIARVVDEATAGAASSYASTATRLDVRRLQLPRLALAEQRRYGQRFRDLAAFEEALRLASRLGEQLVQGLHDGLTDGSVAPD